MQDLPPWVLLRRFLSTVPIVKKELRTWAKRARNLPDPLRSQALSSIEHKAFHCIGGSVYAHYPGVDVKTMIRLIVAFQTISDYLDNLCDRLQVTDPHAFRLLHTSILHALTPRAVLHDYYQLYPYRESTYLPLLVKHCQNLLEQIPHYSRSQHIALQLAEKYCELQVLKHVQGSAEDLLRAWAAQNPQITHEWYEWAAACGSTLGIFLLFALGYRASSTGKEQIFPAYFPWIQGLHILLDYLIDLNEDEENGDLNFVAFYPTQQVRESALLRFSQESKVLAEGLAFPGFHRTVVDGLIALYGSDPKVARQNQQQLIRLMAGDRRNLLWLNLCKKLRQFGFL